MAALEQEDRERALYKFRNGSCPVLVSTDLAARGLDIPGIDNVVHYHMPVNEEAFTHRNGRTARWEARGSSFLLLHARAFARLSSGRNPRIRAAGTNAEACQIPLDYLIYR